MSINEATYAKIENTAAAKPLHRNADYLRWFVSDVAADAGNAIRAFAMPLIGLAITESLSLAGAIGGVSMISSLLMYLPGGVVADRVDRKKLLVVGHGLGVFIWASAIVAYLTGNLNTVALFTLAALSGLRGGFFGGVSIPALRQLVPGEQLPRALAANQARDGAIQMASGPVGGFLVALSVWAPFAAQTIGHGIAWFFSRTIKADLRPGRAQASNTASLSEEADATTEALRVRDQIAGGFRWLKHHPTITTLTVLVAITAAALNGTIQTLILSLAASGANEARIGLVSTAIAVGMIIGSLIAGRITSRIPTGKLAIASLIFEGVALTPLLVIDNFYVVLIFVAIAALSVPLFNSAASGWSIAQIPEDQIGSIGAAAGLINAGLLPLAPIMAGVGLDAFGYTATLAMFIALNLLAGCTTALLPEFRRVGIPSEWGITGR
ncbi:MAG: MFS transporter [Actinomyces sp.]|uniref:MFS transporter n=1 Tax=uncultured Actinomyces sp. TaxID=249061 RepID=UPI002803BA08|nr:MFS transporter [uncultured Actinomyces sp.]MDU4831345.1 MFS transporter [Actinomyces sp.]